MGKKHDTPAHKESRAHWKPLVESGQAVCMEPTGCQQDDPAIDPDEPWDIAHALDGITYAGPAHTRCNRSAGATAGNESRRPLGPTRWAL